MLTQSDNTSNTTPTPPIPTPDEDGVYTCDVCHLKVRVGCRGSKNFLQHRESPVCKRAAQKETAQPKASQMRTIHSYFTKATHSRTGQGTSSRQNQVNQAQNGITPKVTPKAAPASGSPLPIPGQLDKTLAKHPTAVPRPPAHPAQGPTVPALALLASITNAARDLPSLVPEAKEDDDIAHVVLSGGPEDPSEAWEHLDRGLNRLLGYGVEIKDITQRI
jgi:hypothetical protein